MNKEKYRNDPLFSNCVSIDYPDAYECFVEEIVSFLRKHNAKNGKSNLIGISQIKMKFDVFTVYVSTEEDNYIIPETIYDKLAAIQRKAFDYCKHCGKKKTQMVIDTQVRKVCFDHFPTRKTMYGK